MGCDQHRLGNDNHPEYLGCTWTGCVCQEHCPHQCEWLTVGLVNLAHVNNFQGGLFISGTALEFTLEEYEPGVYYIEAADDDDLLATLTSNEANTQVCSLFNMECENANDELQGYLAP